MGFHRTVAVGVGGGNVHDLTGKEATRSLAVVDAETMEIEGVQEGPGLVGLRGGGYTGGVGRGAKERGDDIPRGCGRGGVRGKGEKRERGGEPWARWRGHPRYGSEVGPHMGSYSMTAIVIHI